MGREEKYFTNSTKAFAGKGLTESFADVHD